MAEQIPVTDIDIAREFRLLRIAGPVINAFANLALRICVSNCAELRKKQRQSDQPMPDGRRLASGETD
jgi:hypothetical protein